MDELSCKTPHVQPGPTPLGNSGCGTQLRVIPLQGQESGVLPANSQPFLAEGCFQEYELPDASCLPLVQAVSPKSSQNRNIRSYRHTKQDAGEVGRAPTASAISVPGGYSQSTGLPLHGMDNDKEVSFRTVH